MKRAVLPVLLAQQLSRTTFHRHIHQQVNVTEGGQAVVAGDKVMSRTRGRRGSDGGGMVKNER